MPFIKTKFTSKLGSCFFSLAVITALTTLTFSLVSCGGGGGSGGSSTTASITSVSPVGIVASSVARTITLFGKNFTSNMTLSVADSTGATSPYQVGTTTFSSANGTLSASLTIPNATAPSDKYVNVKVISGSSTVTSTVLGVAQNYKSLAGNIQTILNTNCISCHDGMVSGAPDYQASVSANNLINAKSTVCSNKLRVTAGDPRRSSSVLVDKILVASTSIAACGGSGMPKVGTALTAQNIADIEDWIAGGAF